MPEVLVDSEWQDDGSVQDRAVPYHGLIDGDSISTNDSLSRGDNAPGCEDTAPGSSASNALLSQDEAAVCPADVLTGGLESPVSSSETTTPDGLEDSTPNREQNACPVQASDASKRDLLSPLMEDHVNIRKQINQRATVLVAKTSRWRNLTA